jgi:hypothetical protein
VTGPGPITKISANFTDRAVEALKAAAEQEGDTQTDTLNRAVQAYARIIQLHDKGEGAGRFVILNTAGRPCRVAVNWPPLPVRLWFRLRGRWSR